MYSTGSLYPNSLSTRSLTTSPLKSPLSLSYSSAPPPICVAELGSARADTLSGKAKNAVAMSDNANTITVITTIKLLTLLLNLFIDQYSPLVFTLVYVRSFGSILKSKIKANKNLPLKLPYLLSLRIHLLQQEMYYLNIFGYIEI